jgi:hypothetical protein
MKRVAYVLLFILPITISALHLSTESVHSDCDGVVLFRVTVEGADKLGYMQFCLTYPIGALEIVDIIPGEVVSYGQPDVPETDGLYVLDDVRYPDSQREGLRIAWLRSAGFDGFGNVFFVQARTRSEPGQIPLDVELVDAAQANEDLDNVTGSTESGDVELREPTGASSPVQFVLPSPRALLLSPETIVIEARVESSTRNSSVSFYAGDALLGVAHSPPYRYEWHSPPSGVVNRIFVFSEQMVEDEDWADSTDAWMSLEGTSPPDYSALAWSALPGPDGNTGHVFYAPSEHVPLYGCYMVACHVPDGDSRRPRTEMLGATVTVQLKASEELSGPDAACRIFLLDQSSGTPCLYLSRESFEFGAEDEWAQSSVTLSPDPTHWVRHGPKGRDWDEVIAAPDDAGIALTGDDSATVGMVSLDDLIIMASPITGHLCVLQSGWQLVGMPVHPLQTVGVLFPGTHARPDSGVTVWGWSPRQFYAPLAEDSEPVGGRGYWVYCGEPRLSRCMVGYLLPTGNPPPAGWQLVGAVADSAATVGDVHAGMLWGWHAATNAYYPVHGDAGQMPPEQKPGWLMQGRGYWHFGGR